MSKLATWLARLIAFLLRRSRRVYRHLTRPLRLAFTPTPYSISGAAGDQAYEWKRTVEAKTAAYTITARDGSKIFTNRGASGGVTFTLPAVAAAFKGMQIWVYCIADQTITLAATAGEMVAFNDAAANSAALSTAGDKIGGGFWAVCDGTSWLVFPIIWADGVIVQTVTIAT